MPSGFSFSFGGDDETESDQKDVVMGDDAAAPKLGEVTLIPPKLHLFEDMVSADTSHWPA